MLGLVVSSVEAAKFRKRRLLRFGAESCARQAEPPLDRCQKMNGQKCKPNSSRAGILGAPGGRWGERKRSQRLHFPRTAPSSPVEAGILRALSACKVERKRRQRLQVPRAAPSGPVEAPHERTRAKTPLGWTRDPIGSEAEIEPPEDLKKKMFKRPRPRAPKSRRQAL